jgi:hypothetical protein
MNHAAVYFLFNPYSSSTSSAGHVLLEDTYLHNVSEKSVELVSHRRSALFGSPKRPNSLDSDSDLQLRNSFDSDRFNELLEKRKILLKMMNNLLEKEDKSEKSMYIRINLTKNKFLDVKKGLWEFTEGWIRLDKEVEEKVLKWLCQKIHKTVRVENSGSPSSLSSSSSSLVGAKSTVGQQSSSSSSSSSSSFFVQAETTVGTAVPVKTQQSSLLTKAKVMPPLTTSTQQEQNNSKTETQASSSSSSSSLNPVKPLPPLAEQNNSKPKTQASSSLVSSSSSLNPVKPLPPSARLQKHRNYLKLYGKVTMRVLKDEMYKGKSMDDIVIDTDKKKEEIGPDKDKYVSCRFLFLFYLFYFFLFIFFFTELEVLFFIE